MSRASINFDRLASELLKYSHEFVPRWIVGGKQVGNEYRAASINGGDGKSFSVNLLTGRWSDFAETNQSGGDLISLYAAIYNINNGQAAKQLAEVIGFQEDLSGSESLPNLNHSMYGAPVAKWIYRNKRGFPISLVVRYNDGGKKQFTQWHFDSVDQKWIPKAIPKDRPLYNLHLIDRNPTAKILLCEGEKAADAAQKLVGDEYIATCWSSGATAMAKTDLSPLYNRHVVLWPDNDEAGLKAMGKASLALSPYCSTVAILNPLETDKPKYDAADLLDEAPSDKEFIKYFNKRYELLKAAPVEKRELVALDNGNLVPNTQTGVALPYSEDQQASELAMKSGVFKKWQDLNLMMKSETKVYQNETNIIKILSLVKTGSILYYDEFYKSYMNGYGVVVPEKFSDITFTRYKLYLQQHFRFGDISTSTVKEAVRFLASQTTRNEMASQLESLEWDKSPRINNFLTDIYGVAQSEYTTAVSRIFWLSMVARILTPAVKADIMIILEGDQGIQKSSSLEEIGNIFGRNCYAVAGKRLDNKDFFGDLSGKFLIEMGEINVLLKNSDEDVKEMLSTRNDRFRIPYATESGDHPRTNIFIGTTNQENYLRDETGARRFLPVKCQKVDMDLLKQNKMQYFSEAVYRLKKGEDHWVFPKEQAKLQTDDRMEMDDIWTTPILDFCNLYARVIMTDVCYFGLQMPLDRQNKAVSNRIAKVLKKAGWKKTRHGKNAVFCFENPDSSKTKNSWEDIRLPK